MKTESITTEKKQQEKTEKLYFIQDLSSFDSKTVYSGHSGKGKKFLMYQSDYGKYAMKPATEEVCEKIRLKIERDANMAFEFKWKLIPITEIDLCNFYSDEEYQEFKRLQEEQKKLFSSI